jgi:MarR family
MREDKSQEEAVQDYLGSLGISLLSQWDVLFFLHRHGVSIARDDELARLVGYETKVVTDALNKLESQGLVARSRPYEKAQLYQVSVSIHTENSPSFQQLASVAASREGRLFLTQQLKAMARSQVTGDQKPDLDEGAVWTKTS